MDEGKPLMVDDDKQEEKKPEVSIAEVEKFVNGLTDAQLSAVKATVDNVATRRTAPDLAHMTDNELAAFRPKHYGI